MSWMIRILYRLFYEPKGEMSAFLPDDAFDDNDREFLEFIGALEEQPRCVQPSDAGRKVAFW